MHGAQMARAKGQGVQQLEPRRRAEAGHRAHQAPAQDPGDPAQRHQPERPEAGKQGRAVPEQHDLGDDAFGPQHADHRVGQPDLAPIEGPEAVIELMARLQRRGAGDKEPEPPVGGEAPERRPARAHHRSAPGRGRNRDAGGDKHRRGGEDQHQDLVVGRRGGRTDCEQRAAADRGEDEADRAPHPDAAVIERLLAHRRERDAVAQRHQRRLPDAGDDIQREERPPPRDPPEPGIGGAGSGSERDHHRTALPEPVGERAQ